MQYPQKSETWFLFIFLVKKIFIYLAVLGLSWGMWNLVPWPGIKPRPPALGPCHWATREVPVSFFKNYYYSPIQFSSVAQSCPILCNPMDCSTPGFLVHHQLLELTQTHVHRVSDAIQPSHLPSFPSPLAYNLSQHQGLLQQVSSLHQVAQLVLQLQHQSFQWLFRVNFL